VVAQLGGLPTVPPDDWPVWDGRGPLSHVLTLDCVAAREALPEATALRAADRLAFFYYDGRYRDDIDTIVGSWDPSTHPAARVVALTVHDGSPTHAPPGLRPYPAVPLTAVRTATWPSWELPWVDDALERLGLRDGSDSFDALLDGLGEIPDSGEVHQVGGHASPQQGAVELEVEQFRRGVAGLPFDWSDPDVLTSAADWRPLLQVASDDAAGMMWGDVGQLYWLTRDADPPTDAYFTWQCG